MRKYLYLIKKKKIKSWLKFWLLTNNKFNSILSNIIEGTSFNLQNTVKRYFKIFNIFGNSEQDGTPSPDNPVPIESVADDVNLLNLQDIENHNINSYYESITTDFQLEAGQTYTLSFDAESTVTPFSVGIGYGNNGYYQADILVSSDFQNGRISITFTTQSFSPYGSYLAIRFVRYNASTSYTYSAKNIKLQKGSVATPYSPYNQGTVTIKLTGKNLLPFPSNNFPVTSGDNVLTATLNEDGTIQVTGNKTTTGWSTIWFNLPQTVTLEPGTYTTQNNFVLQTNKGNKNGTFTINETATFSQVYFQQYYAENVNIKVLPMVVKGNELGNYEPYQIPHDYILQTSPLRSLPNGVRDSLEDDGIHRRVGRVVLDGSENWSLYDTSGSINQLKVSITNNYEKYYGTTATETSMLCNYFIPTDYSGYWNRNNTILFAVQHQLFIQTEMDLNTFKTWLSTHNTEVFYELATETIEPYTEEQQEQYNKRKGLYTFNGTTNISSNDEVPPYLQIQYYMKGE